MEEYLKPKLPILCLLLVAILPSLMANIAEFDEVWQNRARDAKKASRAAYNPYPEQVTQNFNKYISKRLSFFCILTTLFHAHCIIFELTNQLLLVCMRLYSC